MHIKGEIKLTVAHLKILIHSLIIFYETQFYQENKMYLLKLYIRNITYCNMLVPILLLKELHL